MRPDPDLVHLVCPYMRGAPEVCLGCPQTMTTPYGNATQACYSLAESVINIVRNAGPREPDHAPR